MRVIVIGAGEVGFDVARILSLEEHDVVVVDVDAEALESVRERLDVLTIQGSGTSADVLADCGVRQADLMIAVTTVDEVNVIACMLADRLGVPTTVARVRSDELTRAKAVLKAVDFGIDLIIQPEESAAAEIARLIRRASATDVLPFADERLQLVGVRIGADSPVVGKTLQNLSLENPRITFRVMAIARGVRTLLPGGNERIQKGDQVFVMTRSKDLSHVTKALGKSEDRIQNVMILGGASIGEKIARHFKEEKNKRIKLIEPDREVAERIAEELPNVLVIHGDAGDIDLLVTEGMGEMDAFVAVTDDEESNLVTCLIAKHLGVQKTVALLSKGAYIPLSHSIGLDAAVSKKLAVSREILRFLRGKHVRSVATVHGLDAEILEIEAKPRSPVTKKKLVDLKLPEGMLVSAVMNGKQVEIATGETTIYPGDRAIVFVLPNHLAAAEKFFDN